MSVSAPTRFTASTPCPVCGGHAAMPHGQGIRCVGFVTDDGYVHCTREEHAGPLEASGAAVPTFAHIDRDDCRCGLPHSRYGALPMAAGKSAHAVRPVAQPLGPIVKTYSYQDAAGRVVYRVCRYAEPKDFRPQHPTDDGGWAFGLNGVERVLYRLPELLAAPRRETFLAEGEKDVDRLHDLGLLSTTNAGGAGSWQKHATEYAEHFRGRPRAVVLTDNDKDGRTWAAMVAASIAAVDCPVAVIEFPDVPVGGDVSDWLDAGHTVDELKQLATAAPLWTPTVEDNAQAPTSTAVDAATLLDDVRAFVRRFLVLPGDHFYDAVALFVLHSHAIKAAETSPRLILKSPEKESGKTRALEVLELLVPAPLAVMNTTTAAIFRLLAEEQATVLFDEVDAIFGSKVGNYEDLRALLNAGYRRGATVARVVGEGKKMRTERFPVFAATALAAIGDLPDTIESRAIIVPMRRRAPSEEVEPFRRRRVVQEVAEVRARLTEWAASSTDQLATADPVMPEQLEDRSADIWEPLLAIADLAGDGWAKRARAAAIHVVKGRVAEDASIGVRLLADIQTVFAAQDRMSSAGLCIALNALAESGWASWNADKGISQRDLAKRLKSYGIKPDVIRLSDGTTPRGYVRSDLTDAFARYLRVATPLGSATSATSATPIRIQVADVAGVALVGGGPEIDPKTGGRAY